MNRTKKLLATMVVVAAATLGNQGAASASAHSGFDAGCTPSGKIHVEAMDLQGYDGWIAVWAPHVYQWTNSGWQSYSWAPQWIVSSAADWAPKQFDFTGLPRGYYQVRMYVAWFYNYAYVAASPDQMLSHYTNNYSGNDGYTMADSTGSYCFEL